MNTITIGQFVKYFERRGILVKTDGDNTFTPIFREDIGIEYCQLRSSSYDALLQMSKEAKELPRDLRSRLEKIQKDSGITLRLYNNHGQNPETNTKTIEEYFGIRI